MSDAYWDVEYRIARELYEELETLCFDRGIPVPEVGDYPRSDELANFIDHIKRMDEYEAGDKAGRNETQS